MGVLEDEAVLREGQGGLDGVVLRGDLDGLITREGFVGVDDEGELAVQRDFILAGQGDRQGVVGLSLGGVEGYEFEAWARGLGLDFDGHGAAVF